MSQSKFKGGYPSGDAPAPAGPAPAPFVHVPDPSKDFEFQSIVVKDDHYHRTRFEDIVLSLVHGIALLPKERRRSVITAAIELASVIEQEIDQAQG